MLQKEISKQNQYIQTEMKKNMKLKGIGIKKGVEYAGD